MKNFGTRLRDARKSSKITQRELAEKLGVEQSTISNYEKNIRVPSATALIDISKALHVSVDYLLGRTIDIDFGPEASSEVSGSVISIELLQTEFLEHLVSGRYREASELIFAFRTAETDLMFFNVNVFEPALIKIGTLWQEGKITVADEHLISNMITGLMNRLEHADALDRTPKLNLSAAFVLVGGEEHELPLRMIDTVFKTRGWTTFYLGKNVPILSLEKFLAKHKINVLGLSITLSTHINACEILVRSIKSFSAEIRPLIMLGGNAIENEEVAKNQLGADLYFESQQALLEGLNDIEKRLLKKKK